MNFYQEKMNQIKVLLGVEVKMAEALLEDGVTKVEAEAFEPGKKIFVVSETGEKGPAPEGIHTTDDGTKVTVDAEGTITAVEKPEPEVEVEIEAEAEVPAGEKSAEQPTKTEGEITREEREKAIDGVMSSCMMAIEEVVKEIGIVKEEMAAYKSKMEKMSKVPGSAKIPTFNDEVSTLDPIEARLEGLKTLKAEFSKSKRKI
jgi:hypothetical protein